MLFRSNQAVWASMNYKVRENLKLVSPRRSSDADVAAQAVCASIVLAIDLLQVPNGPQAEQHRQDIRGTLERIRKISNVSVGTIQHILVERKLMSRSSPRLRVRL